MFNLYFKRGICHILSNKNPFFLNFRNKLVENKYCSATLLDQLSKYENDIKDLSEFSNIETDSLLKTIADNDIKNINEKLTLIRHEIFTDTVKKYNLINNDFLDTGVNYSEEALELELNAGVGGQESALFVEELLDIYLKYCQWLNIDYSMIQTENTEVGGIRKAKIKLSGNPDHLSHIKLESGVHRVQRVPRTERYGRIHTSTVAVSLLPLFETKEIDLPPKDLKIDTFRAQGKGGQHVNKTESAVRITHIPTGIVSECQEERNQLQNREKALISLKAKIMSLEREKESQIFTDSRKSQRGTLSRNEKIRTYNFPQDRITDHRLNIAAQTNVINQKNSDDKNKDKEVTELFKSPTAQIHHFSVKRFFGENPPLLLYELQNALLKQRMEKAFTMIYEKLTATHSI